MMTPSAAIMSLSTMQARIAKITAALDAEIRTVESQWTLLGRVGGQRDDHAARLLLDLRGPLGEMERLCRTCLVQIDSYQQQEMTP